MSLSRCLSCMTPLTGASDCPACGAQVGSEPDNPLYLPAGCLLNNRYLIGRVIGVGGFGIVYLAWDNNLDIKVAVKEYLPKEYAARASDHLSLTPYTGSAKDEYGFGMEKFLDEAKALAKFQDHVGIVTVYESFRANNTAYMVMQYLDGITLKEFLKKQPGERISFDLAVKALTPIMDALREVHSAGYVHRDISPDNIFLTRQKQVKLLDFGAARYAIGEHSKSLTTVLKHGYAPVEQYSTKGNQGPWTDVYAVAATIYRCITGQIPPDAMERMQEECLVSPKQLGIELPLQGELALMKGLSLKAKDRFEAIKVFHIALIEQDSLSNHHQEQIEEFTWNNASEEQLNPNRRRPIDGSKLWAKEITPGIFQCPECGAKHQLQPTTQNVFHCAKCGYELWIENMTVAETVLKATGNESLSKGPFVLALAFIVVVFFIFSATPDNNQKIDQPLKPPEPQSNFSPIQVDQSDNNIAHMNLTILNNCSNSDIGYKFFEGMINKNGLAWPSYDEHWIVKSNTEQSQKIRCKKGDKICFGAFLTTNSSIYFGVGIHNDHLCTDCCIECNDIDKKWRLNCK